MIVLLSISLVSSSQTPKIAVWDSISNGIESNSGLLIQKYSIDTILVTQYGKEELKDEFVVYRDPATNQIAKITLTESGVYFRFVSMYFFNGKIFKGQVHGRFRQTDTNAEVELNTIAYFENDKQIHCIELLPSIYRGNVFWYLDYIKELIKYSNIKLP